MPEITELMPNKTNVVNAPEYLVPNIYNINDFKLIVNNQIALYKTTGQMFTVLSLRLNTATQSHARISFDQLSYSVKIAAHKKDKICTIDDKIYVLITNSDDKLIDSFISKAIETNIKLAIEYVFPDSTPKAKREMLAALDNSEFNKALGQEKSLFKLEKKKLSIIVIGMAGSGKTSLINCFYTWSRGWQCLDEFKNTLISTKYFIGANGGESQDIV